jgi:23S rRNA (uracil1939-C5)-methyltransferase
MFTSGQTLSLTIEKPAAGGRMIARADGRIILVSGAIPGERVLARIERVAQGVAYADTTTVQEASPDRRTDPADPLCGGCLFSHIAYSRQLDIKRLIIADAFARIGRVELPGPVHAAPSLEEGYRMRARLHVRGQRIGFFREGTHDLCDVRQTRQLLPSACDALDRLAAALRSLGVDGVRELELAENLDASDRVVYMDSSQAGDGPALSRMRMIDGVTGLASAYGVSGRPYVTERLQLGDASVSLQRHVLAFFQGNRHLLVALVSHVVGLVPAGGAVIDLYAGVGLFSVSAAVTRGARVTAVEGDRVAAGDLAVNAAACAGAVVAVHQAVEDFTAGARQPADTVVVDPPRSGLSREAIDGLLRLRPVRVVYVSCDVATLARDARRIVDAGYRLDRADAFDLFPNTPHVETVVVFLRI